MPEFWTSLLLLLLLLLNDFLHEGVVHVCSAFIAPPMRTEDALLMARKIALLLMTVAEVFVAINTVSSPLANAHFVCAYFASEARVFTVGDFVPVHCMVN